MRPIHPDEITPEELFLSRRKFMVGAAATMSVAALAACGTGGDDGAAGAGGIAPPGAPDGAVGAAPGNGSLWQDEGPGPVVATTDELGDELTEYEAVTGYNNYYEFSTDKEDVKPLAQGFATTPWAVAVGGLVDRPQTFDLAALERFGPEERVYRHRCVEGWSMVIPWQGFSLARLLEKVAPQAGAKYVRFETVLRPEAMPGQKSRWYEWPYVEGLRLDEAMNELALLATGVYGRALPPQNGAPVRLVVPWKYGFKSIKSVVKIDLVADQPTSLWMNAAPDEYGFYANVNPEVDHPRWSQSSERRIGELRRRRTLMFNGYEEEVAALYTGMDLAANF